MRRIIRYAGPVVLMLASSAMAAETALPHDVSQALAARDCRELSELNQHYWTLPAEAVRDAAIAALEEAILGLPGCGVIQAELVRVEPIQGVNFFDAGDPLGAAAPGR